MPISWRGTSPIMKASALAVLALALLLGGLVALRHQPAQAARVYTLGEVLADLRAQPHTLFGQTIVMRGIVLPMRTFCHATSIRCLSILLTDDLMMQDTQRNYLPLLSGPASPLQTFLRSLPGAARLVPWLLADTYPPYEASYRVEFVPMPMPRCPFCTQPRLLGRVSG